MAPRTVSDKSATSLSSTTSASSSTSTPTLVPSPPRKAKRPNHSRAPPAPTSLFTFTPETTTTTAISTALEDFATKAFKTDAAKQTLVNALEAYEWQKIFGGINPTFVITDDAGRRRYTQLTPLRLSEILGGRRNENTVLGVAVDDDEDEEKGGGARVEEIVDEVDEVEEIVATLEDREESEDRMEYGEVGEGMAVVKRNRDMMPDTPRPPSISRFQGPPPLDNKRSDEDVEEEQKREKKRQKRTRFKMKKREKGSKVDEGLKEAAGEIVDMKDGEAVEVDLGDDVKAVVEERQDVDLSVEMGRCEVDAGVGERSQDAGVDADEPFKTVDSPLIDGVSGLEHQEFDDENKENIPLSNGLPQLNQSVSTTTATNDELFSHSSPTARTVPAITITQEHLQPPAPPQYRETHELTPVIELTGYDVVIPAHDKHEAKGPRPHHDLSEVDPEVIVPLPTVRHSRPLQPPLPDPKSSDLTFEALDQHDHDLPRLHMHRPHPHVSPTHIDLLPLMIPSEDFEATFLSIIPSTPPAKPTPTPPKFGTPEKCPPSDGSTETTETSLTPGMELQVDIGSPPMMDLEETSDEEKSGDMIIQAQIEVDPVPETPELGGPNIDLAVIWEGDESMVTRAEEDDDALLVFPSPDPTPIQSSLPSRPSTAVIIEQHPLSSSWTLFYSSATTTSAQTQSQSRLKPKGAAEFSHGLVHLFSYATLDDLFGAWKALRRRIASKYGRIVEEEGKLLLGGHDEGLGVAFMPDDTNFHFFRTGIKPMWEDEMCAGGGKVMLTGTPARLDLAFHKLVIFLAGGIIDYEIPTPDGCLVVGVVLSKREKNSRVEIWLGGKEAPAAPWIQAVEQFLYAEFPMEKGFPYRQFKATK